jgi:hypothetical protein
MRYSAGLCLILPGYARKKEPPMKYRGALIKNH